MILDGTDLHLLLGVVLLRPLSLHDEGVKRDCGRVVERQGDGIIVVPDGTLSTNQRANDRKAESRINLSGLSRYPTSPFGFRPVIQVGSGPVDDGHKVVADRLDSGGRQVFHGLLPVGYVPEVTGSRQLTSKGNEKYSVTQKACPQVETSRIQEFRYYKC